MYLHEKELVTHIRVYSSPEGYKEKLPYEAIFTVQYIGDNTAFVEGLKGSISIEIIKQVVELLKAKGIKTLRYYRNGKIKDVQIS